jgi:NhaB family Na+:H+ antiporter
LAAALAANFLGHSPHWYKRTIVAFLVLNPVLFALSPYLAGWALVLEFIFTLAMALRCYPLQPGGLLAIEAVAIGMTSAGTVYAETVNAFEVVLLLIFMVAGIYFLKELLLYTFTKALVKIRSKVLLALMFSGLAAVLSAFLDALTVIAVVIAVASGFYTVYHRVASTLPTTTTCTSCTTRISCNSARSYGAS